MTEKRKKIAKISALIFSMFIFLSFPSSASAIDFHSKDEFSSNGSGSMNSFPKVSLNYLENLKANEKSMKIYCSQVTNTNRTGQNIYHNQNIYNSNNITEYKLVDLPGTQSGLFQAQGQVFCQSIIDYISADESENAEVGSNELPGRSSGSLGIWELLSPGTVTEGDISGSPMIYQDSGESKRGINFGIGTSFDPNDFGSNVNSAY
jgi:hypothetical protein